MTMVYDEQNEWYILENKYTLGKPVKFMWTSVGLTFWSDINTVHKWSIIVLNYRKESQCRRCFEVMCRKGTTRVESHRTLMRSSENWGMLTYIYNG